MEEEQGEDAIDRLERGLYTRDGGLNAHEGEHKLEDRVLSVRRTWRHGDSPEEARDIALLASGRHALKISHYALLGSLAFFLISAGIAAYFFFGGANLISPRKIDITITGPVGVDAGEEVPLQITIRNYNAATLEGADLVVEFPEGTRSAANPNEEFTHFREALGDVLSGGVRDSTVRAVLYGEQGEQKTIKVFVEYHVTGSNVVFVKEQRYDAVIGTPSVRVSVESVEEVNTGQEVEFKVEVVSNADTPIDNVLFVAEYPSGFAFTESLPRPTAGTGIWRIGRLEPEEKSVITLRGIIDGQDGDERAFRFTAGIEDAAEDMRIATPLLTTVRHVILKKPFVSVALLANNTQASSHAVRSGSTVRVEIEWMNNLSSPIVDGQIEAVLSGNAFDRQSVRTTDGLYRSSDTTVIWNSQTLRELLEIEPGKRGRVGFSFSVPDFTRVSTGGATEPTANIVVNVKGRRVSESAVPETIVSSATTEFKVSADTLLSARASYRSGPFENSGPMPPKADTETTYTIFWSVTNTTSDVVQGEVSAILPANVRWVGTVSPTSENVTFAPVGGTVRWNLGTILAGTGAARPPREVAFQVALTPSISDVTTTPTLIRESELHGTDTFSGTVIDGNAPEVTTGRISEPGYRFDDAVVLP